MRIVDKVLSFLGFSSYIKISGKGFDDLSNTDVASMINAFLENGNEDFEQNALYEFRLMEYRQQHLEEARLRIIEIEKKYRSVNQPDGLAAPAAITELQQFMNKLKHS